MKIIAKELKNMTNFEAIKDRVVYKLTRKDEKMFNEVAYVEYLDMMIVFYIKLDKENEYALVTKEIAEGFDADTDDLMLAAMENTPRILGASVRGIFNTINYYLSQAGSPFLFEELENINMPMVLTNNINTYGASTMLYKDLMKGIANKLNRNFYIIPCSIHELILVPVEEGQDVNYMIEMISNVNDTELPKKEILSYSLYRYTRETNEVTIVK